MVQSTEYARNALWVRLMPSYGRRLHAYARRTRCSDEEASDIVAEVWSIALTHEHRLSEEADHWPTLRSIARKVCAGRVGVWRREVSFLSHAVTTAQEETDAGDRNPTALRDWWLVVRDKLSDQPRIAVDMRFRWGWRYEHVSWALGCTESTARVHVKRGLAKLRDLVRSLPPPKKSDLTHSRSLPWRTAPQTPGP